MGNVEWSQWPPADHPVTDLTAGQRPTPGPDTGTGPVLVAAFEGWNDAGDAATGVIEHLWERWDTTTIAAIDPEDFYDFTATRPHVRRGGDGRRVIDWPANEFGWARPAGTDGVVLLRGVEPQLRWRTFCESVLEVARAMSCTWVLTIGSLLADVPHTRPTPVFGTAEDAALGGRLSLAGSDYEGPTGIVGVLQAECAAHGIPSASLWGAVPSYAPSAPSPKATTALTARTAGLLHTSVDTSVLDAAALTYEHQLDELIADDEGTLEYVRLLEREHDADGLVDEVERFLREQ